jgi:hypothetical protein
MKKNEIKEEEKLDFSKIKKLKLVQIRGYLSSDLLTKIYSSILEGRAKINFQKIFL